MEYIFTESEIRAIVAAIENQDVRKIIKKKYPELFSFKTKPEPPFDSILFLRGIFKKAQYKVDRENYPDVAFFGLDTKGNYLFHYNRNDNTFWLSFSEAWQVLQVRNLWNFEQTKMFVKITVEEYFNWKGVKCREYSTATALLFGQHFKLDGLTDFGALKPLPGNYPV
jgi:hypothetical protein